MSKSQKINMYFSLMGIESKSKVKVLNVTDKHIEVDDYDNDDNPRRFDIETGECINDNNYMGGERYLQPEDIAKVLEGK